MVVEFEATVDRNFEIFNYAGSYKCRAVNEKGIYRIASPNFDEKFFCLRPKEVTNHMRSDQ